MQELWQLYDEQGNALEGQGATKDEAYKGLLHGASQVWIWHQLDDDLQVLVQRRARDKRTWGDLLDISAAGHIDLGEEPTAAAVRETQEEIGLEVAPGDLQLISKQKQYLVAPSGSIENEWIWVYGLEVSGDQTFTLQAREVESLLWKNFDEFCRELRENDRHELYVPHGLPYYEMVIGFIEKAATQP